MNKQSQLIRSACCVQRSALRYLKKQTQLGKGTSAQEHEDTE